MRQSSMRRLYEPGTGRIREACPRPAWSLVSTTAQLTVNAPLVPLTTTPLTVAAAAKAYALSDFLLIWHPVKVATPLDVEPFEIARNARFERFVETRKRHHDRCVWGPTDHRVLVQMPSPKGTMSSLTPIERSVASKPQREAEEPRYRTNRESSGRHFHANAVHIVSRVNEQRHWF